MKRIVTDEQLEIIQAMAKQGVRNKDIAQAVNLPNPTVSYWIRKSKGYIKKKSKNLCKGCKYYHKTCDYYLITGKRRDCNPQECTYREEGEYAGSKQKMGLICVTHKPPKSQMSKYIYSQSLFDWEMYDEEE